MKASTFTRALNLFERRAASATGNKLTISDIHQSSAQIESNTFIAKRDFSLTPKNIPEHKVDFVSDKVPIASAARKSKILQALEGKLDSLEIAKPANPLENTRAQAKPNKADNPSKLAARRQVELVEKIGVDFDASTLLYADALQKTADKYGVVIGLRMPSEQGQIHLKEGHPTKNFHVKAKSSNTGPTAGFIPEKALFSKVGITQQEKHNKSVQDALGKGAQLVELQLSNQQIEHALATKAMTQTANGNYLANYQGIEVIFIIEPPANIVRELDGSAVKVLTNPPEIQFEQKASLPAQLKPITADYDLFSISPRLNQSINATPINVGHGLNNKIKHVSQEELGDSSNDYPFAEGAESFNRAIKTFTEPKHLEQGDVNQGNIHHFGRVIVDDINKNASAEFKGGKLVWHGDEYNNPFSQGFDPADAPIFFIPNQAPQQIMTKEQLIKFNQALKKAGFAPDYSPKFGI